MVEWMKETVIAILGLLLSFFIYLDKKKTKRFDKIDHDFEVLRDGLATVRREKSDLDRDLARLSKEVDLTREHMDKQFLSIDSAQRDMKDYTLRQHEEIKKLIEDLSKKVEKYFEATNNLHVELVAHVSKGNGNG